MIKIYCIYRINNYICTKKLKKKNMKYFAIEGTFNNPNPLSPEELKKAINEHIKYLQKGFDEGWILISGPKAYTGGGVILMKAESINIVEDYINNDPLKICGVQIYNIIEFKLHDCQEAIKNWFN